MSDAYRQLLDATVQHLQDLKAAGERFVPVTPETLAALGRPAARPTAPARPAFSSTATNSTAMPKSAVPTAKPAPAPMPTATPLDAAGKAAALEALRPKVLACVKCPHLVKARTQVVFGVGNPNAELMFVGEAPGADEDTQGEPFVGLAGQLLNKIIAATGLKREDVFIGNILKCRPDTPGQSAGNRKPTPAEMQVCIPWLITQIEIIRPKVLVALGATAVEGLIGKTGISKLRGSWQSFRGIPLMPTYHPAYLLRNQALSEKRKVWEDMMQVMEKLGLPITEKQRNYFLTK